ncbi:MAG: hypothetical protein RLY16_2773 [Bacteroidota bacterium]|jgi:CheY-like chemotaxis protein
MAKKIKTILLIDDDEATNFIHRIIIDETGITEKIDTLLNGKEGLARLTALDKEDNGFTNFPDIIFLDLNMPLMDGWEFLDAYSKLVGDRNCNTKIFILSTSINPDDQLKSKQYPVVAQYLPKPLTNELLEEIAMKYF